MILSGAILAVLVALLTTTVPGVYAAPVVSSPSGHLEVDLIKKAFDICTHHKSGSFSGTDNFDLGASVPPSEISGEGESQRGCVEAFGDRFNQYLFTGEQMAVLVAVRDTAGVEAIDLPAVLEVNGHVGALCDDITNGGGGLNTNLLVYDSTSGELTTTGVNWFGHPIDDDLAVIPPAKTAGTDDGLNNKFDKLFQCVYTATSSDSGPLPIDVMVTELGGAYYAIGAQDQIWFNPEISLDITPSYGGAIVFEDGSAGQTVYSTNYLSITNKAEGGVVLVPFLAVTNLVSEEGLAKCPATNIIDVATQMEYRCKIGTVFNNPWSLVTRPDDTGSCTQTSCDGASPLLTGAYSDANYLTVDSSAECWFRLSYPVPCIGTFDQGEMIVYARAL